MSEYVIVHSGVKGMKWGVRKYQNPDGTYTQAGLKRYFGSNGVGAKIHGANQKAFSKKVRNRNLMKNMNAEMKRRSLRKAEKLDEAAGRKTIGGAFNRAKAGIYSLNEKSYADREKRARQEKAANEARFQKKVDAKVAKTMKKGEINKAKQELKEAKKDLKVSQKLNRKAQKGIFASRENQARQEASDKKMHKAEAKLLEKQAALGKAKGGEKGEMKAYMKAMSKTGLSGSIADVQSGGKATRTYDAMAAKKGKEYAQKVEKKVRNQKVAMLVGGTAVYIGGMVAMSYADNKYKG